jgi:hypothetical protein
MPIFSKYLEKNEKKIKSKYFLCLKDSRNPLLTEYGLVWSPKTNDYTQKYWYLLDAGDSNIDDHNLMTFTSCKSAKAYLERLKKCVEQSVEPESSFPHSSWKNNLNHVDPNDPRIIILEVKSHIQYYEIDSHEVGK